MQKGPSFPGQAAREQIKKNGSAGPMPFSVRHGKFLKVGHGQGLAEEISLYLVALT